MFKNLNKMILFVFLICFMGLATVLFSGCPSEADDDDSSVADDDDSGDDDDSSDDDDSAGAVDGAE